MSQDTASETPVPRPRILVMDDERTIVDTLSAVLDIRGFEVLTANNGNQAMRIIEEQRPDAAVLDVIVPGMDGLSICRRIKRDPDLQRMPVLMCTVITRDSDLPDGFWKMGCGADDFVTKPFDPFHLADRVERLLRIHNRTENAPTS